MKHITSLIIAALAFALGGCAGAKVNYVDAKGNAIGIEDDRGTIKYRNADGSFIEVGADLKKK